MTESVYTVSYYVPESCFCGSAKAVSVNATCESDALREARATIGRQDIVTCCIMKDVLIIDLE